MGQDMHEALTLMSYGWIDTGPFTGVGYRLEDIQQAFDTFPGRM